MVIDDADSVDPATLAVLGDVREIAGICLPHAAESIFFEGFSVTEIKIAGAFEVIALDESLHGADADGSRYDALLYEFGMYLSGIEPWVVFFQLVDTFDRSIRKYTGRALVGALFRHQTIEAFAVVYRYPLLDGLRAVCYRGATRKSERLFSHPAVVFRS